MVEVITGVAVNDGASIEREPPEGAETPALLAWVVDGLSVPPSPTLAVTGALVTDCACLVSVPADAAVAVDLRVRTQQG
jgi:hypothetical protein